MTGDPQVRALAERLEGWWGARVTASLGRLDDRIDAAEVLTVIREIADTLTATTLPLDERIFQERPADIDENAMYVRQLRLIQLNDGVILLAARDFVRAARQIAEWMREELLFVNEFTNCRRHLTEEWRLFFEQLLSELQNGEEPCDRGRALYWKVMQLPLPIRRDWTQAFIMRQILRQS